MALDVRGLGMIERSFTTRVIGPMARGEASRGNRREESSIRSARHADASADSSALIALMSLTLA
ncbi:MULTISPECIES: hypothetical protein [unclassified Caballeronia]|uniref:hypothetical protein n=1 Tax=unclassified Caballeronia TaxID=2646786 RepID=UPI0013EA8452|nr:MULTISPECIES: hypothetical protein [unclassified Caballeronia]